AEKRAARAYPRPCRRSRTAPRPRQPARPRSCAARPACGQGRRSSAGRLPSRPPAVTGAATQGARMSFAEAFAPLVDLVYPPRCPLCGEAIAAQDGLCGGCWAELVIPGEPACVTCQRPFGADAVEPGAICAPCLANPPRHDGIAAGTLYNE